MLSREAALTLVGWQVCSLLLTLTGYCSSLLVKHDIDAPTAQSVATYSLLSAHSLILWWRERRAAADGSPPPLRSQLRPWQWFLLAAADVEANYLLVFSYQFTDLTSVSLLDAFTVPMAMILSRACFGATYGVRQLSAAAICIGGLIVLLVSDLTRQTGGTDDESGRQALTTTPARHRTTTPPCSSALAKLAISPH